MRLVSTLGSAASISFPFRPNLFQRLSVSRWGGTKCRRRKTRRIDIIGNKHSRICRGGLVIAVRVEVQGHGRVEDKSTIGSVVQVLYDLCAYLFT